jgi:hypothetical protein
MMRAASAGSHSSGVIGGGMTVAPMSLRNGHAYEFIRGGIENLAKPLPTMRGIDNLMRQPTDAGAAPAKRRPWWDIPEGFVPDDLRLTSFRGSAIPSCTALASSMSKSVPSRCTSSPSI